MHKVYIDFETSSIVKLPKVGAYRYAEHPSTVVMAVGVRTSLGVREVLKIGELHKLRGLLPNGPRYFVAHNASFDRLIWNRFAAEHDWPHLEIKDWRCTMARAFYCGMPPSLDKLSGALGVGTKAKAGMYSMRRLSAKPGSIDTDSEDYRLMLEYCDMDMELLVKVDELLPELPEDEQSLWWLDQQINDFGICIDRNMITNAIRINDALVDAAKAEFKELVNYEFESPTQAARLLTWLADQGFELPDLRAETVEQFSDSPDIPSNVQRVLELRQVIAGTAVTKYKKMIEQAGAFLQGQFQYHGAHTGRWAARGVQPHNMPRGGEESPLIATSISIGDGQLFLDYNHENPRKVLKEACRSAFVARPGNALFCADFSGIENCVLAWVAGEQRLLEVIRSGADAYAVTASMTFSRPIDPKVDKEERTVGKTQTLASGYQGGVGALVKMASQLRVDINMLAENGNKIATAEEVGNAEYLYPMFGGGMAKDVYIGLDVLKQKWRANHPAIVGLWGAVQQAAMSAVHHPGVVYQVGGKLHFGTKDGYLVIRLPSGRYLRYPSPRISAGKFGDQLIYKGEVSGKWVDIPTYGGALVENIVQAISRDILVYAMRGLTDANWHVCLHVHDEVCCDDPADRDYDEFLSIVKRTPPWAEGCPIDADGWKGYRYRK